MPEDAPKLIIDTDWKSQAQAEKERLAAAEKKAAPPPPPAGAAPAAEGSPGPPGSEGPREARFTDLVRSLATQALLYMGAFPDPETGQAVVALDLAKLHIDLLGILEEKTKGNLNAEEAGVLQRTAYELRMEFVQLSRELAKAVEQGRISPMGAPPRAPRPPGAAPAG